MDIEQALQTMTPEQIQRVLGRLPASGRQDALLEEQMRQAEALGHPQAVEHSTGMGAALGGFGDAVDRVAGAAQVQALRGKRQDVLDNYMQDRVLAERMAATQGPEQTPEQAFNAQPGQSAAQDPRALVAALRGGPALAQQTAPVDPRAPQMPQQRRPYMAPSPFDF